MAPKSGARRQGSRGVASSPVNNNNRDNHGNANSPRRQTTSAGSGVGVSGASPYASTVSWQTPMPARALAQTKTWTPTQSSSSSPRRRSTATTATTAVANNNDTRTNSSHSSGGSRGQARAIGKPRGTATRQFKVVPDSPSSHFLTFKLSTEKLSRFPALNGVNVPSVYSVGLPRSAVSSEPFVSVVWKRQGGPAVVARAAVAGTRRIDVVGAAIGHTVDFDCESPSAPRSVSTGVVFGDLETSPLPSLISCDTSPSHLEPDVGPGTPGLTSGFDYHSHLPAVSTGRDPSGADTVHGILQPPQSPSVNLSEQSSIGAASPTTFHKTPRIALKLPTGYHLSPDIARTTPVHKSTTIAPLQSTKSLLMAPVKDTTGVHSALKDTIQHLYDVQATTQGYVPESNDLLVDKLTDLTHSLSHLQTLTSKTASPHNPIHQVSIAPEIIDYVDDGRNPDIFTREFVENVQRGNAVVNGKRKAFADFSQVLADVIKEKMPAWSSDVDGVMEDAGFPVGGVRKRESDERNGR